MVLSAEEALKTFDTEGKAETVDASNFKNDPGIRLQGDDPTNIGQFIIGKYLGRREAQGQNGKLVFLAIRLESTNAPATTKKGDKYVETSVNPGDMVSVMASSRLDRAIQQVEVGSKVFIKYEGMKKVKTKKGSVFAHTYTVKALKSTLTPQDVEYLKSRASQITKEDVETNRVQNETEAEEALNSLEG